MLITFKKSWGKILFDIFQISLRIIEIQLSFAIKTMLY
jgi:hypothetical protein